MHLIVSIDLLAGA